ncbi:MAG: GAF domain-containing protein [Candidatus Omnitrophica bacterium]|nr:GAF domain-containing protein [Candidatus Omnitrophota bacterium]
MIERTKKTQPKKSVITQSQQIEILSKIVDLTSSDLDLSFILGEVVRIINTITRADSVFVYLFDSKKKVLTLLASKTPHKKELGAVTLKAGEGITGWVAKESKIVHIKKNAYKDSRFKNFDVLPEDKYEAFLSIPIIFKKSTIGVINVQHKKERDFSKSIVTLISTIAKQVSGVIENSRLYAEAKKKAAQFDQLMKVSQSITSESYLDEILNLIVVVTAEMLDSKICSVMLLDEKKQELSIKATQFLSEDYKKKPNIKVEKSLSGEAVKAKKAKMYFDVRMEEKYAYRNLADKEQLSSMLSVPMIVKDRVIGVINIYTKRPHAFSQEEVSVLQMVSNQAAIAIENTKLVEETVKAKEALETRKLIERAKGVLMRIQGLAEEEAHKVIHKKSMNSCKSMKEVAESIILMDELQKKL